MPKDTGKIPEAAIRRLPKYYRYLTEKQAQGMPRVSSFLMSRETGIGASQIRRDLGYFGGFGQQGYGYNVERLKAEIAAILGLDRDYRMVIVGAGNIGQALVGYTRFAQRGFHIVGVFDVSEAVIGGECAGQTVRHVEELRGLEQPPDIGVICTPKEAAQKTADLLCEIGVQGIWNFAPAGVQVREGVALENVHLNDSLYVLSYRLGDGGVSPARAGQ